jgi:pimeloyl-ACP methyl ester carboxylesterase
MEHVIENGMFVRRRRAQDAARGVVVLVHGLGESALGFEPLLARPELSAWELAAPDLPGYGRTAWPAGGPPGLVDLADAIASWLRERYSSPVTLLGHSMGGVVALLLAERHPELVAALLDVEGNKSRDDCAFSGRAADRDLAGFVAEGFDDLRDDIYRRGHDRPELRGYYASLRLADPRCFHRHGGELVALSAREDLAGRLASLPVPHHYVAGVPEGVSARSRELLAANEVAWTVLKPAGHWPFVDQPERFASLVAGLLDGWAAG